MNQNIHDFEKWLRSLESTETAEAGSQCGCWLYRWFESQGEYPFGVFPGAANYGQIGEYEILLADPKDDDFDEDKDAVDLEVWACHFGQEIDRKFFSPYQSSVVTVRQALETLESIRKNES